MVIAGPSKALASPEEAQRAIRPKHKDVCLRCTASSPKDCKFFDGKRTWMLRRWLTHFRLVVWLQLHAVSSEKAPDDSIK